MLVESVVEAGAREGRNALVNVVHTLDNAVGLEIEDKASFLSAVGLCNAELSLAAALNAHFGVLVNVAVGVTRDADGLFPGGNVGDDALHENRASENGAVEDSSDSAVGRLPHFFEVILCHTGSIRCNCCTLNCNFILLCCIS